MGNIFNRISLPFFLDMRQRYAEPTYKEIEMSEASSRALAEAGSKILVLDLDETLVHSTFNGLNIDMGIEYDFIIDTVIENIPVRFQVYKRPYVDEFLDFVSKWYKLVVYTASIESYGSRVIDVLENGRCIFQQRFFRQHCKPINGTQIKDLYIISNDMKNILIVDNSPIATRNHPNNSINIKTWLNDPLDKELLKLLPVLDALRFMKDVRKLLRRSQTLESESPSLLYSTQNSKISLRRHKISEPKLDE